MNDSKYLKNINCFTPSISIPPSSGDYPLENILLSNSVFLGGFSLIPGHRAKSTARTWPLSAFLLPDQEWALGQVVPGRPRPGTFASNVVSELVAAGGKVFLGMMPT